LHRPAIAHDRDAIGEPQRFFLIMGHEHRGGAALVMDGAQGGAHLGPEIAVQGPQRLVHEERLRPTHQGPRQPYPLLVGAGQVLGMEGRQGLEP
jgi:hypothetical protein